MKSSLLIVSLMLLSSCTVNVKEFRASPLEYLAQAPGHHQAMAGCLMLRLEESSDNGPESFRLTTVENRSSLLISRSQSSGFFSFLRSPLAEFVLTELPPKSVFLESRTRHPDGNYFIDRAKPFIGRCGQQSLAS
jgi:hypothetical protein